MRALHLHRIPRDAADSNELDFYNGADDFILAAIAEHTSEEERMDAPRPFFEAIFFWERPQIGVQSRIERGIEHQQESV
jgi:hypothetical protein